MSEIVAPPLPLPLIRRGARGLLSPPPLRPAIFLDRDGTLIHDRHFLSRPEEVALLPGAAAAVARLAASPYLAVVVTNQAVVARGLCSPADLGMIHDRLDVLLAAEGAALDAVYACPHHPGPAGAGWNAQFIGTCACRKPAPGLVALAAGELNIDVAKSWMIGDATVDLALARRVGCRAILVGTGYGGGDGRHPAEPDFKATDVAAAVAMILETRSP